MPRVISFKVGPAWVAFTLNDYGQPGPRRWSWHKGMAEARAARP